MADLIKIKGGKGNVPELQDRELGFRKGEEELYIGTDNGNLRLCGAKDKAELKSYIDAYIEANNGKNNEIDQLIIAINNQIATLENSVATINEKVADLEETVANINSRLDAMNTPDE